MAKLTREERQARRAKAILDIAQPPSLDTVLAGLAGITSMIPIGGGVMATALTEWRQEQFDASPSSSSTSTRTCRRSRHMGHCQPETRRRTP